MQELILLDSKVDDFCKEERPPLYVCRPNKPQHEAESQPPLNFDPIEETQPLPIPEPSTETTDPPLPVTALEPEKQRNHHSSDWIRGLIAVVILGVTVWGYPKLCPYLDPICSGLFRYAVFPQNIESEPEERKEEIMPQEEEISTQEEQSEQEMVEQDRIPEVTEEQQTQSVSASSDATVLGTIDNMSGDGTVKTQTLSATAGGLHFSLPYGMVKNMTDVSHAKLQKAAKEPPAFTLDTTDQPQILIMHTHATESFLSAESDSFDTEASFRTKNKQENIVRIGSEMVEILESAGIGVLHDTTLHDAKSYSGSYARSAETVKSYLEQYPSIRIVLDVHRDAIGTEDTITAPTTTIEGRKAAQIMIISGCDDGTMDMPHYMDNFRFAAALQQKLEGMYPTLTRPILFDYRKYNQDLTTGSLLIEIGSNANTLDQAVYSGRLFANALVSLCQDLTA